MELVIPGQSPFQKDVVRRMLDAIFGIYKDRTMVIKIDTSGHPTYSFTPTGGKETMDYTGIKYAFEFKPVGSGHIITQFMGDPIVVKGADTKKHCLVGVLVDTTEHTVPIPNSRLVEERRSLKKLLGM